MYTSIYDLPTPSLVVEESRLDQNILTMQSIADAAGVKLRPHTKTHKSIVIAKRQIAAGATGITVAKVSEAEVFVKAGFDDVLIAYPIVGKYQLDMIAELSKKARLSFGIDTIEGAKRVDQYLTSAEVSCDVLIEVNTGSGRCGVDWDGDLGVELAKFIHDCRSLNLKGVMTHSGRGYRGPQSSSESNEEALRRAMIEERDRVLDFAAKVIARLELDQSAFEISLGSTPTASVFENTTREGLSVTEIRPGTYIYQDTMQVGLGSAKMKDCALSVLSTLVSQHRESDGTERLFIDAGKKVFTSDGRNEKTGYGRILHSAKTMTPLPHVKVGNFSEEHGWLDVEGGSSLSVGDTMRIVPSHVCVTVNTQDRLFLVDGENVVEEIQIDARGKVW